MNVDSSIQSEVWSLRSSKHSLCCSHLCHYFGSQTAYCRCFFPLCFRQVYHWSPLDCEGTRRPMQRSRRLAAAAALQQASRTSQAVASAASQLLTFMLLACASSARWCHASLFDFMECPPPPPPAHLSRRLRVGGAFLGQDLEVIGHPQGQWVTPDAPTGRKLVLCSGSVPS